MAWAVPKLIRREKGVMGVVRVLSSSSMAFSSIESGLIDRLPRRKSAEVFVGDVPERPNVVTDSRRRWSAFDVRGVGKELVGGCDTELLRNRLVKALEVMEPRRCRARSLAFAPELPVSEDMAKEDDAMMGMEEENGVSRLVVALMRLDVKFASRDAAVR